LNNEPQKKIPGPDPAQAGAGAAPKAEKVRSSRYEWEGKSNESGKAAGASNASRRSILLSLKTRLKRLFSGNRGPGNRGFFDNDDDASPSAA
jgi:hypothetical protein